MTEPVTSEPPRPATNPGGARAAALRIAGPLAMLFLTLGVVQIFLAGFGVFSLEGDELGSSGESAFDPHRIVGNVMALVALLLLVAVAVARPGRRPVAMAVLLLVVVAVLQTVLAQLGEDTAVFGGLHALFGIGALGIASSLLADSRRVRWNGSAA